MQDSVWRQLGAVVVAVIIAGVITFGSQLGVGALPGALSNVADWQIYKGLDLAGGTELDYAIDLSEAEAQNADNDPTNDLDINEIAESVRDSLEARVNPNGVGEVVVKRSQLDDEQHVLIQLPPTFDVNTVKSSAEQDNRLVFYEEDSAYGEAERERIRGLISQAQTDWDAVVAKESESVIVDTVTYEERFVSEVRDAGLAEKLQAAEVGTVLPELIETQNELRFETDDDGNSRIVGTPGPVVGLVRLTDRGQAEREVTTPAGAEVRHILFAYPGAERAAEDVKYADIDTARAEAQKVLNQLKADGTENFAELAKEYSTEPAAQQSGGDLRNASGEYDVITSQSPYAPDFIAGIHGAAGTNAEGLVPDLVETPFGFHIIDVVGYTEEVTETKMETQVSYDMLTFRSDELRWKPTELTGAQLVKASVAPDEIGKPSVVLLLNDEGADLFAEMTGRLAARTCSDDYGNTRDCLLDTRVGRQRVTTATVSEQLITREPRITNIPTYDIAKGYADRLNLGAIEAPVKLVGQMTIEPQLGEAQLSQSVRAGMFGILATMIYMILAYGLPGVLAAIALSIYMTFFAGVLKAWGPFFGSPIVMTLAGVAGLALSIGLAVDGNILIFERIREELRRGRSVKQSIELGFQRALSAITDSNLTTLFVSIILYSFGTSLIKGFAIMLIVGTSLSWITAYFVSRVLLRTAYALGFDSPSAYGVKGGADSAKTKNSSGGTIRSRS